MIVLFDSYYLCPAVIRACEAKGFPFVGVAKKNRNFFPDGRPRDKRKLGRYGANVLRRDGRSVTCRRQEAPAGRARGATVQGGPRQAGVQPPPARNRVDGHRHQSRALGHENRVVALLDPLGDRRFCSKCRSSIWDWATTNSYGTGL